MVSPDWMAMRRVLKIILLLALGLLCLAYLFVPAKTFEFSQAEVEEAVMNKLPYEISKGFVTITVRAAELEFRKDNKVGVEASFEAKGLTLEGEGQATIQTGIRYDNGSFYLSDLAKENIHFEFSENSKGTISDVKSTIANILQREQDEAAVSGDADKAESVEGVKEYASKKLQSDAEEALESFLKSIPIYSLRNQGGKLWLAALALEDVKISEGNVTAVLSFQILIARAAGAVFSCFLIVFVVFGPIGIQAWWSRSRKHKNPPPN